MLGGELELFLCDTPADEWTAWHERIIRARLLAYFLRPGQEIRQRRIMAVTSFALQAEMEKALADGNKSRRLRALLAHEKSVSDQQHWQSELTKGLSDRAYRHSLYFPKLKGTRYLVRLLTAGHVAMTFAAEGYEWDADKMRDRNRISLSAAQEHTASRKLPWTLDSYKTIQSKRFKPYLSISHLAAAFYLCVKPNDEFSFGRTEYSLWRKNMKEFLGHAYALQGFLPKQRERSARKSPFDGALQALPSIPGIETVQLPIKALRELTNLDA